MLASSILFDLLFLEEKYAKIRTVISMSEMAKRMIQGEQLSVEMKRSILMIRAKLELAE
ncbi:hypothetical protein [Paenibacillus agricola]|uniref:Uncharacterized protein n=1 Tax=Paenibacillus agricola TaxID=2716264 RepID=A0ABX0JCZ3_9BACL|nr:hypothetical protein [Paenibacillus agricola]NHN34357.1 hypothetical protein [Paenibacillus agricola]